MKEQENNWVRHYAKVGRKSKKTKDEQEKNRQAVSASVPHCRYLSLSCKYMNILATLGRMAVLRKQRELLQKLRQLEVMSLKDAPQKYNLKDDFVEKVALISGGNYYIPENLLILALIGEEKHTKEKSVDFTEWKKCLETCIKDDLVDAVENKKVKGIESTPKEEELSKRLVQVSANKGMEMLDFWHFWLVQIPKTFSAPSKVIVTIATALGTSIIGGLVTASLINSKNVQYSNEQPKTEILRTAP